MTPTKEQIDEALEYCTGRYHSCVDCHILAYLESDGEITCSRRELSIMLLAKCAEVEELRKALIHISELTSESAGGPWTKDIHKCARKALEGKE